MKSNVERFVELYKKLEEAIYVTYKEDMGDDDSPVPFLENHKKFKKYRDDIYVCRHFRNILNHTRKVDGNFVVEPSDKMVSFFTERSGDWDRSVHAKRGGDPQKACRNDAENPPFRISQSGNGLMDPLFRENRQE